MKVSRQVRKALAETIRALGDDALAYVREEAEREQKRRRLQVRERRAAKRVHRAESAHLVAVDS